MLATRRHIGAMSRRSWAADSSALQSRSNQIRNSAGGGAVAGTPGTDPTNWLAADMANLTKSVVGTQTGNGVEYVGFRWAGTSNATSGSMAFEATTQVAATVGQVWTDSAFMWLVVNSGATPTISIRMSERDAGGLALANNTSSVLALTSTPTRFSYAATLANASTAFIIPQLAFFLVDVTAYDFTLWVGGPQVHLGSVALSPIRTTTAARSGVHASAGR